MREEASSFAEEILGAWERPHEASARRAGLLPWPGGSEAARNQSGSEESVYATRESRLFRRPLQGAFLIPPVLPVVLIVERRHVISGLALSLFAGACRCAVD